VTLACQDWHLARTKTETSKPDMLRGKPSKPDMPDGIYKCGPTLPTRLNSGARACLTLACQDWQFATPEAETSKHDMPRGKPSKPVMPDGIYGEI